MADGLVRLHTPNLAGRSVGEDDVRFVSRVWNDERVAPSIGGTLTQQEMRDRVERWRRHWERHGFGVTLFHARTTGEPIGWGGLQHSTIGIGDRLTLGYVIAPEEWGRGYASEIAAASVAHAFGVLGARDLYASILSTNEASRRVVQKAGLSVDSEIDHGDHVEVIYAIRQ